MLIIGYSLLVLILGLAWGIWLPENVAIVLMGLAFAILGVGILCVMFFAWWLQP